MVKIDFKKMDGLVPAVVQVGTVYRRSLVAYSFIAAYSARLTSVLAM